MKYKEFYAEHGMENLVIDSRNIIRHHLQIEERKAWIAYRDAIRRLNPAENLSILLEYEKSWQKAFTTLCDAGLTVIS